MLAFRMALTCARLNGNIVEPNTTTAANEHRQHHSSRKVNVLAAAAAAATAEVSQQTRRERTDYTEITCILAMANTNTTEKWLIKRNVFSSKLMFAKIASSKYTHFELVVYSDANSLKQP